MDTIFNEYSSAKIEKKNVCVEPKHQLLQIFQPLQLNPILKGLVQILIELAYLSPQFLDLEFRVEVL